MASVAGSCASASTRSSAFAELEDFIDLPVRTYSSGMFMRLGFSLATHLSADVLLLDEVFAVGDEAFQRKCFGKIFEFKARGGTIVFVSHTASAVESLCERALLLRNGRVEYDGSAHDALRRYQLQLADDQDPSERAAGLREWGSGEARVSSVALQDRDGNERQQFLSGEPLVLRFAIEAAQETPEPQLLVELRDHVNTLIGTSTVDAAHLGWDGSPGASSFEFALDAVPLVDGRFQLCVAVLAAGSRHVYHRIDGAAEFIVYPEDNGARGCFASTRAGIGSRLVGSARRDELAPLRRLADPHGAHARAALHALHARRGTPSGRAAGLARRRAGRRARSLRRPRAAGLQRRPHGPAGRTGARPVAVARRA